MGASGVRVQRLGARGDRDVIEIETVDSPPSVPGREIEDLRDAIAAENVCGVHRLPAIVLR
ncbi:hypothetical protein CH306_08515 [Rhodococcus sp. 15-725-2-2b]|nr:hypothetical protein CH264_15365 [Rhodococcus sp. 06-1477-1A]OZE75663.1 hypothetical protein CH306_08515 [Rhodococcus sp. 15-725-2-2b]